MGHDKRSPTNS